MPSTEACKSYRLPTQRALTRGRSVYVQGAKKKACSRLKRHEKRCAEDNIFALNQRISNVYPGSCAVASAQAESEKIEVEPPRSAADVEETGDEFECVELSCSASSATLMELSLWETEAIARRSQAAVDMGAINSVIAALRSRIHHLESGKEGIKEGVDALSSTQDEAVSDSFTPLMALRPSVTKSDDEDDAFWLSRLSVKNKQGNIDENDL